MEKIFRTLGLTAVTCLLLAGCEKDFEPTRSGRSEIKSFVFTSALNGGKGIGQDTKYLIDGNTVVAFVDNNCSDYSELVPSFTLSDRALAYVGGTVQDSGVNAHDFSDEVVYEVVAEDGSSTAHTVKTVSEKPILSFGILKDDNASLLKDAISIMDRENRKISLELPAGSNLGTYIPTFTLPEGMTLSLGGEVLESGVTPVDFTKTQTVTVSSWDDYPRQWEISTIIHIIRTECEMESFMFRAELSPSVFRDVEGIIDAANRTVTVPSYWADLNVELIPTFAASEYSTVTVGVIEQVSGVTPQDFSVPVVYTIAAEDGVNSKDWRVQVVRPSKFRIPDKTFREYLIGKNRSMFDGDSLIIANALEWAPTDDIYGNKGMDKGNIGDFTGIEFFPKLEAAQFCDSGASSLNLSKNNQVRLLVWWNSLYTEIDISNSKVDLIEINQTAGTRLKRIICRNSTASLNINALQPEIEFIDYRGSSGNFDRDGHITFVDNAKVMMDKAEWERWPTSLPARQRVVAAKNMTVELYGPDGVTIVETLRFNQ